MSEQPDRILADLEGQAGATRSRHLTRLRFGALMAGLLLLAALAVPVLGGRHSPAEQGAEAGALAAATTQPTQTATAAPTASPTPTETTPQAALPESYPGLMVMSRSEAGYWHLFAYDPIEQNYTRLTYGPWDDIHPAISPDGGRVAFASDRGGGFDLYVLDLESGAISQVTEDLDYDGRPSWSPDGSWLAYERYTDGNLEIFIRPVDGSVEAVQVSVNPGADFGPAWSPTGQQVAFISDRSGAEAVWLVDLEAEGEARFRQVSSDWAQGPRGLAWSPDGERLAWSRPVDGYWLAYAQDPASGAMAPLGAGQTLAWSTEDYIAVQLVEPGATYLSAYTPAGALALPPQLMEGQIDGLSWGIGDLAEALPGGLAAAAGATPEAGWRDTLAAEVQQVQEIVRRVDLPGVTAPYPELSELAVPAFQALQSRLGAALGWDALSHLENALVPLNRPLEPGRQQDWLYTGRAFSLPTALLEHGWMLALREEYAGQTYWRLYLRAAAQDGSQGRPLTARPWDFSARYSGAEADYQAGGRLAGELPAGYWVDLTALAAEYGWLPRPALPTWQSYFQASLYNLLVLDGGLSWGQAMQQLYSEDTLAEAGIGVAP